MRRVLISGANRGIGLEFTRQLLAAGDTVHATCRNPDAAADLHAIDNPRLKILPLDIRDDASIAALRDRLSGLTDGIDLLINNAGVGAALSPFRAQLNDLGTLDREKMLDMIDTNAVSPIMFTQAMIDLLTDGARILVVSSNIGSIGLKSLGHRHGKGRYAYGASKAALNLMTRALANDLADRGIVAVAIHPGYVRTDMSGPHGEISPEESVTQMLAILDRVTLADSGTFFNYTGEPMPY